MFKTKKTGEVNSIQESFKNKNLVHIIMDYSGIGKSSLPKITLAESKALILESLERRLKATGDPFSKECDEQEGDLVYLSNLLFNKFNSNLTISRNIISPRKGDAHYFFASSSNPINNHFDSVKTILSLLPKHYLTQDYLKKVMGKHFASAARYLTEINNSDSKSQRVKSAKKFRADLDIFSLSKPSRFNPLISSLKKGKTGKNISVKPGSYIAMALPGATHSKRVVLSNLKPYHVLGFYSSNPTISKGLAKNIFSDEMVFFKGFNSLDSSVYSDFISNNISRIAEDSNLEISEFLNYSIVNQLIFAEYSYQRSLRSKNSSTRFNKSFEKIRPKLLNLLDSNLSSLPVDKKELFLSENYLNCVMVGDTRGIKFVFAKNVDLYAMFSGIKETHYYIDGSLELKNIGVADSGSFSGDFNGLHFKLKSRSYGVAEPIEVQFYHIDAELHSLIGPYDYVNYHSRKTHPNMSAKSKFSDFSKGQWGIQKAVEHKINLVASPLESAYIQLINLNSRDSSWDDLFDAAAKKMMNSINKNR